jgi:hypothetical protein
MAQLTTVLAHTSSAGKNLLVDFQGGPTYATTVHLGVSGREKRNQNWSTPRHVFRLTFRGLYSEMADLLALFTEAKGQAFSFLYTPALPGAAQGSYRFADDGLDIAIQASGDSADPITAIRFGLMEVLSDE